MQREKEAKRKPKKNPTQTPIRRNPERDSQKRRRSHVFRRPQRNPHHRHPVKTQRSHHPRHPTSHREPDIGESKWTSAWKGPAAKKQKSEIIAKKMVELGA